MGLAYGKVYSIDEKSRMALNKQAKEFFGSGFIVVSWNSEIMKNKEIWKQLGRPIGAFTIKKEAKHFMAVKGMEVVDLLSLSSKSKVVTYDSQGRIFLTHEKANKFNKKVAVQIGADETVYALIYKNKNKIPNIISPTHDTKTTNFISSLLKNKG